MMTMASSEHLQHKEGFKLLQEDNLDDRPCAAVKDFVASVLNKKDLKDQDVASSYRNLVEYRDSRRSPAHGYHPAAAEGEDDLGLPSPPSSPPPQPSASKERAERLPNRLFDEMYEEMGMKSGDQMDLDFVEFLMGQGGPSQSFFLTPEGGGGGGNVSAASSNISTPSNGSGGGGYVGDGGAWQNPAQVSCAGGGGGTTTALSSTSNSPVRKRIHLSTSQQNSPEQLQQHEQELHQQQQQHKPQPKQQYPQHVSGSQGSVPSPCYLGQDFKMPPTPLTPAHCDIPAQDLGANGFDSALNAGAGMSLVKEAGFSHQRRALGEGLDSVPGGSSGGVVSSHAHPSVYQNSAVKSYSHASRATHPPLPLSSHPAEHTPHRVKGGETSSTASHHHHQHQQHYPHHQQYQQTTPLSGPPGMSAHHPQSSKGHLYHKPCKQSAPPAINTETNGPHVRWRFPGVSTNPVNKQPPTTPTRHHHQPGREGGDPAYPHLLENAHGVDLSQKASFVPSENRNTACASSVSRNTACASSLSLPSTVPGAERGVCESETQTAHSSAQNKPVAHLGNSSSQTGSVHTQTPVPAGSKDLQFYGEYPHSASSAPASGYNTQVREPSTSFHQHSQSRAEHYSAPANCAVSDSSTLNSSGFISHSSYPGRSSAGLNPVPGTGSSYIRPSSCEFESCAQSGQSVKSSEHVGYTNNPQCNTESSVSQEAGRSMPTGAQVNTHTHFEGLQSDRSACNSASFSGPGVSNFNTSSCMAVTRTNPSTSLPVNHMHAQQHKASFGSGDMTRHRNESHTQHQRWGKPSTPHRQPGVDGLDQTGQQASCMPADSSQPLHQDSRSCAQSDALDAYTAQSDFNLQAAMNYGQDVSGQRDRNLGVNAGQDVRLGSDCQNLSMRYKEDMGMPSPGQGISARERMPPPPSPVGFQPSAVSTPVLRARPPSHGHRMYGSLPEGPEQSADCRYPAGHESSGGLMPTAGHHYDSRAFPAPAGGGGYPPPWAGHPEPSVAADPVTPRPARMPSPHLGHMPPVPYPHTPQTKPFVPSQPSRPGPSQSPSSCLHQQSQHAGSSHHHPQPFSAPVHPQHSSSFRPIESQGVSSPHPLQHQQPASFRPVDSQGLSSPHPLHSQHPASLRPINSQGLSSSRPMQPQQPASFRPIDSHVLSSPSPPIQSASTHPHPSQPFSQRFPPPQNVPYSSNPDPSSFPASFPDLNSSLISGGGSNNNNNNNNNHVGPASRAFSAKQKFIQNLILDERNAAYRSHPLFPLLRDLVIAGMNFDDPRFYYQQLLCMLPRDFEKLLQNFLQRNPPAGDYQSNFAAESVLMDSLRLAHASLVEKIGARQEQEQRKALSSSSSMQAVDEFCDKFDRIPVGPGNGMTNGYPPPMGLRGLPGDMMMQPPLHIMTPMGGQAKFMVTLNDGEIMGPVMLQTMNEAGDVVYGGTPKHESKKHPSLPKEAVSCMLSWLKAHKDNPYPSDEEKTLLIKQTGLTINQINYWFTNARRRILPKWSRNSDNF